MKKRHLSIILCVFASFFIAASDPDCESTQTTEKAASGVQRVTQNVEVQSNGKTYEQKNVARRLADENKPGSIKHLYILSAYSGQVLFYSTVVGKVTSSGKRLSPTLVNYDGCQTGVRYNPELIGDDGTYGSSIEYLYWWDTNEKYHQQYLTGGMILHISDAPVKFRGVTINVEEVK